MAPWAMKITPRDALRRIGPPPEPQFAEVFQHGTLSVEMYAPIGEDLQQPHTRDEVYVVARGSGQFVLDGARDSVESGDFLFVPAFVPHRFENFSHDFATWVLFYGPEGGESEPL